MGYQVHYFGNTYDELEDATIAPGGQSWDTASVPMLCRGTAIATVNKFAAGTPFPGAPGLFIESCEITRAKWGFCWTTLRGKGLLNVSSGVLNGQPVGQQRITGVSISTSQREVQYPMEIGDHVIIAPGRYATNKTGPRAGLVAVTTTSGVVYVPERVRVLVPVDTVQVSGMTITSAATIMDCPLITELGITVPTAPSNQFFNNLASAIDVPYRERVWGPTTGGGSGWESTDFQPVFTKLGNFKMLVEWRATYAFKFGYQP